MKTLCVTLLVIRTVRKTLSVNPYRILGRVLTHITLHGAGCSSVLLGKTCICIQLKSAKKPCCLYLRQGFHINLLDG